jgi:hypothetical protein
MDSSGSRYLLWSNRRRNRGPALHAYGRVAPPCLPPNQQCQMRPDRLVRVELVFKDWRVDLRPRTGPGMIARAE